MSKKQERAARIKARNEKIVTDFLSLSEKKAKGVKIYTQEFILQKVASKYFLSTKTIEDIIYNRKKSHE